jgi:hypothetical protein
VIQEAFGQPAGVPEADIILTGVLRSGFGRKGNCGKQNLLLCPSLSLVLGFFSWTKKCVVFESVQWEGADEARILCQFSFSVDIQTALHQSGPPLSLLVCYQYRCGSPLLCV